MEGTVIIGDVLQQLQIDAPAEEVLQEIELIRAGERPAKALRLSVWRPEWSPHTRLMAGIVLVPLAAIIVGALIFNPAKPPMAAGINSRTDLPLWIPPMPSFSSKASLSEIDEKGFNASSILEPLSQVPDDQPIHCTTKSLQQLFSSYTQSQLQLHKPFDPMHPLGILDPKSLAQSNQLFDVRPNLQKPWTLIKHEGRLYIRAWVAAQFSEAEAEGITISLHSSNGTFELGIHPIGITLPASFWSLGTSYPQASPGNYNEPVLAVTNIHLDKHAWEKWSP